jgi:hypothetical protein
MSRPFKTITICGSMRFFDQMLHEAGKLTRQGHIVLMPFVAVYDSQQAKDMLDEMHRAKIKRSYGIHVVDCDADHAYAHIGESTRREIAYAEVLGKHVTYLSRQLPEKGPRP